LWGETLYPGTFAGTMVRNPLSDGKVGGIRESSDAEANTVSNEPDDPLPLVPRSLDRVRKCRARSRI
jgi:hypothetical protein